MKIHVFRLSHRPFRDQRISTHCGLVARAFGAEKMVYSGEKDRNLENSINKVVKNWGGWFEIEYADGWKKTIEKYRKKKFIIIHLTMYGLPVQKTIDKIRKQRKNILLIAGGEKVPPEIYCEADFNISVTSQPHSEVSALAVFLDRCFKGKELEKKHSKALLKVIPQKMGKKVVKLH
jgi:tRNA (cytidine56-2'-O)-methyltransferase